MQDRAFMRTCAAAEGRFLFCLFSREYMRLHCLFVISGRFSLDDSDGICRTGRQAVAESVAVIIPNQLCLPVYDGDRALVACLRAQAAARAGRLVNFNDRPFRRRPFPDCAAR